MRTESADWRTKFFKSADWCNPDNEPTDVCHFDQLVAWHLQRIQCGIVHIW